MDFIQKIDSEGGSVYLVGGTVRDRFYNRFFSTEIVSKDFDLLCCNIKTHHLEDILKEYGHIKEVGKAFGIVTFKPKGKLSKYEFDIALPRKEKSTGPGYRDFEIVCDESIPIEEDLSRRDTTANAIAYRLRSEEDLLSNTLNDDQVVDVFNGAQDIQNKLLRAVGDAYKRLLEDPNRILRALRQSAQFHMTFDKDLEDAIIHHTDLLDTIVKSSPVRLTEEIVRLLKTDGCYKTMEYMLKRTNIAEHLDITVTPEEVDGFCNSLKYCVDNGIPVSYTHLTLPTILRV